MSVTADELRRVWVVPDDGRTHSERCWKWHLACAMRVALDLLAAAERKLELTSLDRDLHRERGDKATAERNEARAAMADARKDSERLDWLEGEWEREEVARRGLAEMPLSLFRQNNPITRASIDAARKGAPDAG